VRNILFSRACNNLLARIIRTSLSFSIQIKIQNQITSFKGELIPPRNCCKRRYEWFTSKSLPLQLRNDQQHMLLLTTSEWQTTLSPTSLLFSYTATIWLVVECQLPNPNPVLWLVIEGLPVSISVHSSFCFCFNSTVR